MADQIFYLEITKFWEGVDDDSKDDVESNCCDEDEERQVEDDEESKLGERVVGRVTHEILSTYVVYDNKCQVNM